MTQKSCAVGMRNAKLGNHLKISVEILVHNILIRSRIPTVKLVDDINSMIKPLHSRQLISQLVVKLSRLRSRNRSIDLQKIEVSYIYKYENRRN